MSGNAFRLASEHWQDFGACEQELETCIAGQPMIVLCTYPLAGSGASDVLEVARAHQVTLARRNRVWEVVETPELKQAQPDLPGRCSKTVNGRHRSGPVSTSI